MQPRPNVKTFVAPAYWAAYLIDRDEGQIRQHDGDNCAHTLERIDAWLAKIRPWRIRDVARHANGDPRDPIWTAVHDCMGFVDDFGCELAYRAYLAMRCSKRRQHE